MNAASRKWIDNRRALAGAVLGIIGTLTCNLDKLPAGHAVNNRLFPRWRELDVAMLHLTQNRIGTLITKEHEGFAEVGALVKLHAAALADRRVIQIIDSKAFLNSAPSEASFPERSLVVGYERLPDDQFEPNLEPFFLKQFNLDGNAPTPGGVIYQYVCPEYAFLGWFTSYRQEWFLGLGLRVVLAGFVMTAISRVRRETFEVVPRAFGYVNEGLLRILQFVRRRRR